MSAIPRTATAPTESAGDRPADPADSADPGDPAAGLRRLAAEMTARGFRAGLCASPAGQLSLRVHNPRASVLAETVYAGDGRFWWSWQEPIAAEHEVATAATILARVLRAVGE